MLTGAGKPSIPAGSNEKCSRNGVGVDAHINPKKGRK